MKNKNESSLQFGDYKGKEKCDHCGGPIMEKWVLWDFTEYKACSQKCAEAIRQILYADESERNNEVK